MAASQLFVPTFQCRSISAQEGNGRQTDDIDDQPQVVSMSNRQV